jgi:hypothetical protein
MAQDFARIALSPSLRSFQWINEFAHMQMKYNIGGSGTVRWSMTSPGGLFPKPHYEGKVPSTLWRAFILAAGSSDAERSHAGQRLVCEAFL